MELNVVNMYSHILNMYGDRGNVQIIKQRCLWRGIDVNIQNFTKRTSTNFNPEETDIVLIGGGSDHGQSLVSDHFLKQREFLQEYVENRGVVLAICGSYQLFGSRYIDAEGNSIPCLEIFDVETRSVGKPLIGNIVLKNHIGLNPTTLVGFENHGGHTYHDYQTLGKVLAGNGNNGEDCEEGLVYKNFIGTYLHGPVLPKNPQLADRLILNALKQKYGVESIAKLNDKIEQMAHNSMVNRIIK
ncbi:MAG: glutamine amidotransferase [Methanobrevibacter sp.]|uniref:type 1 glutamine amidotransferase n=1 Tax=Methanobrevibacter sp. TaxID=66852 RepID=UPI0026DF8DC0|nr:glutamine amidotransferase [Methanobrevibacter sp.]MDO5848901.1 glutamine amidotransferase [Methanobrevibacter sp.]